jgi:hypothetical protein
MQETSQIIINKQIKSVSVIPQLTLLNYEVHLSNKVSCDVTHSHFTSLSSDT